jgi:EmrB/QacA subfamily drug resistance transporter
MTDLAAPDPSDLAAPEASDLAPTRDRSDVAAPGSAAVDAGHPRRWAVFAVVVLGAFMAQLDLFIVNVAFPSIERDFPGVSSSSLSWVLNAYAIVFAACLVPAGRLGDLIGRRRTFELGVIVFAIASAGCAAAPGVGVLVAARVVQAIGAAMVIPTSIGLLLHAFGPTERAGATGAWASGAAIAASAGPPLGGLLVLLSWRWIFIVNLPLAAITLVGSRRIVPEVRHPEAGGRPDLPGIALLVAGIGGLVLAIVEGQSWGWGSAAFVLVLIAAAVLLAAFLWRCGHHPSPIVELSLLRLRPFAVANATMLAFYVGFGTMLLGAVLFLTGVWHEQTVIAGLEIAPGPLVVALLSGHVKRLVARFGARAVTVAGALLLAVAGAWWAWRLDAAHDFAGAFLPGMLVAGLGVALTQATLYGVIAVVLPAHRFATGSGVLNMCRQISLALGVAVLVAILGSSPDVAAFHRGFELIALSGLAAAGLAALLPARVAAPAARQSTVRTILPPA